ncbi:hypothetical protein NLS1_12270 [Nocardioides sp. LS1]|nr:hypothetical protein NLS1_12270 [Nocardioides sp. LS1]
MVVAPVLVTSLPARTAYDEAVPSPTVASAAWAGGFPPQATATTRSTAAETPSDAVTACRHGAGRFAGVEVDVNDPERVMRGPSFQSSASGAGRAS